MLNNHQVEKILNIYELGHLINIKRIEDGFVNYNFDVKTDKGNFIIHIIGEEFNRWKRERLKIQFKLFKFLKKKKFLYDIPMPLKNKYGKHLLKIDEHYLWIYRKIGGEIYKKYNLNHFKEIAKALATYHNFVENFKYKDKDFFDFEWLFEKYIEIKLIKPKNNLDRLMLKNLNFFKHLLKKISKIDFDKSTFVFTHSDFSNENLVFKNDELKGILDFDNLQFAPREKDIGIAIKRCNYIYKGFNKRKLDIFLKEYKKYSLSPAISKKLIVLCLIKDNCSLFWWFYTGIKKDTDRYKALLKTIEETKKLVKLIRWNI